MAEMTESFTIKMKCRIVGGGNKLTRWILAFLARLMKIDLDADVNIVS